MTRNRRVLIMDDEDFIQSIFKSICQSLGYDVEVVSNGKEMIDAVEKSVKLSNPFFCIFMDLNIHGHKDGKDFIQQLLKIDSQVKAIITSGDSTDPVMENYKQYGFVAALEKPFKLDDIENLLETI